MHNPPTLLPLAKPGQPPRHPLADMCCAPTPARPVPELRARRGTLADLDLQLHCSIIGTCMTTTELRRLVPRFAPHIDRQRASDLDIHHGAVELCCEGGPGRKELNKALDTRHALVIRKFKAADSEAALRDLWRQAMASGEIPGAYWALMTHSCVTPAVRALAFGDVHMLSHLVGASNRADIRRLVALEEECQQLKEQNERQQARLRDLNMRHAAAIRVLENHVQALTAQSRQQPSRDVAGELAALKQELAERDSRLALHAARHDAAERRRLASEELSRALQERAGRMEEEADAARAETAAAEQALAALAAGAIETTLPPLNGACIAYIGGRPGAVAILSRLVAAAGGELLAHDGGIEERRGKLAAVLARAQTVVFPVDCISHNAMDIIKRTCEQSGAAWHPVRSASVASGMLLLQRLFREEVAPPRSHFCLRHG